MRAEYAGSIRSERQEKERASLHESELVSFPDEEKFANALWISFLTTHPELTEVVERNYGVETRAALMTLEEALGRNDIVRFEGTDVPLSQAADSIYARAYQSARLVATISYDMWLAKNRGTIENDFGAFTAPTPAQGEGHEQDIALVA